MNGRQQLLLVVGVGVEVFVYDEVAQISKVDYFQPLELVDWTDFVEGLDLLAPMCWHQLQLLLHTAENDHWYSSVGKNWNGLAVLPPLLEADSLSRTLCFDYQWGWHCFVSIGPLRLH